MHFRDFNAIAAELREGDKLRLELNGGIELTGELNGCAVLGSPRREGELTVQVGDDSRRLSASELSAVDLLQ